MRSWLHSGYGVWGGIALLLAAAGCDLPQDPMHTLAEVRGDTMVVGISEAPPWVVHRPDGTPAGVEVVLVRRFAETLGAHVVWRWGAVGAHMEALARYELDLVAAGLTRSTPWRRHVGLTRPYYTMRRAVGVPPGMPPPGDLDGVPVAVARGTVTAALLEARGAIPVYREDLATAEGPVAAAGWQLARWGFDETGRVLRRDHHVLAVPPGENGWLVRLERFLASRRAEVGALLIAEQEDEQGARV